MSITSWILAKADATRFAKAATSLRGGEYTVAVTYVDHNMVRAFVESSDRGKRYGTTIMEGGASCSCADAMYRGGICKHSVLLAIKVMQDGVTIPEVTAPDLTLKKMIRTFDTSMI